MHTHSTSRASQKRHQFLEVGQGSHQHEEHWQGYCVRRYDREPARAVEPAYPGGLRTPASGTKEQRGHLRASSERDYGEAAQFHRKHLRDDWPDQGEYLATTS